MDSTILQPSMLYSNGCKGCHQIYPHLKVSTSDAIIIPDVILKCILKTAALDSNSALK